MLQPFSNVFLRFKNSARCASAQNDTKILLSEFPTPYTSIIMNVTRIFLTSWLVVLVLSLGTNTIAATAVGVAHEINCADRHDRTHSHNVDHKEFVQSSDNMMIMNADDDHETCMNHACPALFTIIGNYQVDPQVIYSKLRYFDPLLREIERVESLHRPPST